MYIIYIPSEQSASDRYGLTPQSAAVCKCIRGDIRPIDGYQG